MSDFFQAQDEITEYLLRGFHTLFFHQRLAVRAFFPVACTDFVTAQVQVVRRKEFGHFVNDVADHFEILFAGGAKHIARYSDPIRIRIVRRPAEGLRVGGCLGEGVARKVDLRNYLDVAECRVTDDFTDIVLRVVASVAPLSRAV